MHVRLSSLSLLSMNSNKYLYLSMSFLPIKAGKTSQESFIMLEHPTKTKKFKLRAKGKLHSNSIFGELTVQRCMVRLCLNGAF